MRTMLLSLAVLALAPCATASGASPTITGDAGEAVPLGGNPSVRNIEPSVTFGFAPDEIRYGFAVLGPAGDDAANPLSCTSTEFARPEEIQYRGNGTYTLILRVTKDPEDTTCATAVEQRLTFLIDATTTVLPPPGVLLTGPTPTSSLIPHPFAVQIIPGTHLYEMEYAVDAKRNPDGSLAGDEVARAKPSMDTGRTTLTIGKPGRYTFVARASSNRGITPGSTPWSAPVFVTVMAPFGVDTALSSARIRAVRITGNATEPTATGTVVVSIAKGAKGRAFRRVATVRLGASARFVARFRVKKPGTYRVRYVYKGNATVRRGTATEVVRLKR